MRKVALLLAALLLLPALALYSAADSPGTAVTVAGPERLVISRDGTYNVKIFGSPEIRWGFWVNISGSARAEAKLASPDGTVDSSKSYIMSQSAPLAYPEFNFTLTAPPKPGPLVIEVLALALEGTGAAGQTATARWSVDVKAIRNVQINSTVRNSGEVPVADLKVAFMVRLNGAWTYISNETVPSVEPRGTQNVSAPWDTSLLDSGEYTIRIIVDPDGEKVQYYDAKTVTEKRIVLRDIGAKVEPLWYEKYQRAIGFFSVIVVAAVIGLWWWRRKKIV